MQNCCKRTENEFDINNVNLNQYFDDLESVMDMKIDTEKKAIKNWHTLHLRLTLFRNLRKQVKD